MLWGRRRRNGTIVAAYTLMERLMLAWRFLRFQKGSALTLWYQAPTTPPIDTERTSTSKAA
jgi:hypothetical protein